MRKIILILLILAVAVAIAGHIFSRKAPDMLRHAIERALNKTVTIREIEFNFPWNFELRGVDIRDSAGPFLGESCFSVDQVHLSVSPLSLSRRDLVIDRVDVEKANIIIRSRDGDLHHVLSDAMVVQPARPIGGASAGAGGVTPSRATVPLNIHQLRLADSHFRFVDYDVQSDGFVIELYGIQAVVKDIALPVRPEKTTYHIEAHMGQGREEKPADFQLSGWTVFSNYDTDARLVMNGVHLPYFQPYLAEVTPARVEEGYLTNRSSLRIQDKELIGDMDFELTGLYFSSYEDGQQLFGLKADEILSFLKDAAGRLHFQIVVQWNIADKNVKKRDVVRRSIERSLKKTVLGNLGNILENTLKKIGERGVDSGRDDWEGTLKKVKELFR